MGIKNRLINIMFFLVNASILAIIGLVISSIINPNSSLFSNDTKKGFNWFNEHLALSQNIVIGLYVVAVIFALIAGYNILATLFDSSSDKDIN